MSKMIVTIKKGFALSSIFLLVIVAVYPTSYGNLLFLKNKDMIFRDKPQTSFMYINASCSYDYGMKVGRLLGAPMRIMVRLATFFLKNDKDNSAINDMVEELEMYCPFVLDELRGLSDSIKIDLEDIIALFIRFTSVFNHECTVTLATGVATRYNETFLTLNIDTMFGSITDRIFNTFAHRVYSRRIWIVNIGTMNYSYAFFGIPIFYELPFLNEKGLGLGSTGTSFIANETANRTIDRGPGIPTFILQKFAMMTCKTVTEVADLYITIERASKKGEGWFHQYDSSSSCFCDKNGGILIIEQTHNHIICVFGDSADVTGSLDGILWHTNHHLWLEANVTGSLYPDECPSSKLREERARNLLEFYYGNITIDVCKKITRDHAGGFLPGEKDSGDICRHPDSNSKRITAFAWIIVPKDMRVYWTHKSPCMSIFYEYDFSLLFH